MLALTVVIPKVTLLQGTRFTAPLPPPSRKTEIIYQSHVSECFDPTSIHHPQYIKHAIRAGSQQKKQHYKPNIFRGSGTKIRHQISHLKPKTSQEEELFDDTSSMISSSTIIPLVMDDNSSKEGMIEGKEAVVFYPDTVDEKRGHKMPTGRRYPPTTAPRRAPGGTRGGAGADS